MLATRMIIWSSYVYKINILYAANKIGTTFQYLCISNAMKGPEWHGTYKFFGRDTHACANDNVRLWSRLPRQMLTNPMLADHHSQWYSEHASSWQSKNLDYLPMCVSLSCWLLLISFIEIVVRVLFCHMRAALVIIFEQLARFFDTWDLATWLLNASALS